MFREKVNTEETGFYLAAREYLKDRYGDFQTEMEPAEVEDKAVGDLMDTYQNMALGIQAAVNKKSEDYEDHNEGYYYFVQDVTALLEANGHEIRGENNYGPGYDEPTYIQNYKKIRGGIYEQLLETSIDTGDFTLLLSTIKTTEDSYLAKRLQGDIYRKWAEDPCWVVGDVDSAVSAVDSANAKIGALKSAMQRHAKRQRNFDLRRQLGHESTGVVKAVAIGVKLKANLGLHKYLEQEFYQPLNEIAALPPIEERLIQKEKAGRSILEG